MLEVSRDNRNLERHEKTYDELLSKELSGYGLECAKLRTPADLTEGEAAAFGEYGKRHYHFFMTLVLGYTRLSGPAGIHGEMCRRRERKGIFDITASFRGSFKTTCKTIGGPIWGVVRDPESYSALVTTENAPLGMQWMSDIDDRMELPTFKALYPEIERKHGRWQSDLKQVSVKRGPDPSIEFMSWRTPFTGRHPFELYIDDLVNDANWNSASDQERIIRKFGLIWPGLEKFVQEQFDAGSIFMSMTPYAPNDANCEALRRYGLTGLADVWVMPVRGRGWIDDHGEIQHEDSATYNFPEEWDDRVLERMRVMMPDPKLFSSQYHLDLSVKTDWDFRMAWIKHISPAELEGREMTYYIAHDGASGKGSSRPATALVGVDADRNIIILRVRSDFHSEAEVMDGLFEWIEEFKPAIVGVERYSTAGYTLMEHIQTEAARRGVAFYMVPMTNRTMSSSVRKEQRIKEIMWFPYQRGQIYHLTDLRGGNLEKGLGAFPSLHLDEVDAASYAVGLGLKNGYQGAAAPRIVTPTIRRGGKVGYLAENLTAVNVMPKGWSRHVALQQQSSPVRSAPH